MNLNVVIVALFIALTCCTKKTSKAPLQTQKVFNGKNYWEFKTSGSGPLAQSGEFSVSAKEVQSLAPYRSLLNKEKEILFVNIYKQFITQVEKKPKKLKLSFKKLSRSPSSILNQFGIPAEPQLLIEFSALDPKKGLAEIDGKLIKKSDLDLNNYVWASFATEMFHYHLLSIDKILKQKIIKSESEKLKLSVQNYLDEHIFKELSKEISKEDIIQYQKKYSLDDSPSTQEMAKSRLLEERKKRGVDYILEKYVMELPVVVNLEPPQFELEVKEEWTPFIGNPKGDLVITLFSDTRNSGSEKTIRELVDLTSRYQNLKLNIRPLFSSEDQIQNMISQMHFCVWMKEPSKFQEYFLRTLGDQRENTEKNLYKIASEIGLSVDPLKQCLISQQSKEVIDYHLKYASYLGLLSGPIVFIDGEVLHGAVRTEDLEKIIHRKLQIPSAGVW